MYRQTQLMCIIYFIVATCFDRICPSSGDLYEYKTMRYCIMYVQYLYERYINGPKMTELGRNLLPQ